MGAARDRLLEAFREFGIQEGEFTLASGATSKWYLDGRQVTFRGDLQPVIGQAVLDVLAEAGVGPGGFDAVGGMTLGADPVAIAVATASGARAFSVRKEPKGHGVGGRFAGPISPDDRVVAVEDTVTTGGSFLKAIDALEEFGCTIVAAVCLLDRGGVIGDLLAARGVRFHAVLGAPDVGYEFGS
ncbi:MAG: orotate phosphoribosyltransferase [Actinobacteria bacterium]|nr:orotate phosphoribosyltransferase [Actinomycetota bacterium]